MLPRIYYRKTIDKLVKHVTRGQKFVVFNNTIANIDDLYEYFSKINKNIDQQTKILITYYNHLWEPVLKFASFLGLRIENGEQNWLDEMDIKNLLELTGFEIITSQKQTLIPFYVPYFSEFINKYIATLPILNSFCITTYLVAQKRKVKTNQYSVSIIIPARNEAGNIKNIIPSIPKFGKSQEIIFVEGNSTDKTWHEINKLDNIVKLRQSGKGKADAVRLGFKHAKGEILIIYDADRTVDAKDLKKFYDILTSGKGEFVNGSRLVYPMEKDAMRTLNKIGNKLFSLLFTWILGQRFKDTLCGTKAFFKNDYLKFEKFREDPFLDFELIFGAIGRNLKVIEIPVRYKERKYGSTNISRFKHGLQLFKMTWIAFKKFRVDQNNTL